MSDRYTQLFAEYTAAIRWDDLPDATVHEIKRRIMDSIGVAIAAFAEDAPKAVRAYAYAMATSHGATLWGTPVRTSPEIAGFVNGVMVRYLDYNDTYLSKEPLHPSDMIPALMALAEWRDTDSRDLLTAIAIAYEIGVCLCDAASLRAHRWDHVNYIAIGTACGAAKILGLSREAIEHAIAMAIVPHAAMRQTRAGELSMWKGAAAANAARNGVFAALLAAHGMTGPYQPFTGEMGFFRQLLHGETFDDAALVPLREKRPPGRIMDTYIKYWPVEYHAQSAVDAALQIRREIDDPRQIASVHIDTFRAAYEIIAKDPEKWAPQTRETADHSLPYITLVALLDGDVTAASFSHARITDPHIRTLLRDHTTLREDPELTAGYPEGIPNRITVRTRDGRTFVQEVRYPRGHAQNPMTDDEVVQKLYKNVQRFWNALQIQRIVDCIWNLESCRIRHLVQLMCI